MPTLDPVRAAFVQEEYRTISPSSSTVLGRNPAARVVEVMTNLDEAGATALANKYLAENIQPRVFDIELEGVIHIDSFIGGPPRYIPNFPRLATDGRTMKVISASVDYDAGRTTVRVRG